MGTFDIVNSIYHNFFSVCALIPAAFMLSLGIILLNVPHKSKATFHLALTYIMLTIFYSGYVIAAMVYHPVAAYHRWVTAGFVTLSEIHFIMAFFYLPDEKNPGLVRLLGAVLYGISLVSWAAFIFVTYHARKIYNFDGHYWDFDADAMSTYIAVLVIAYLVVMAAVALWRIATIKTKLRWTIFSILILILITISIPAMTNLLSRNGILDRGTYQITQDLFTIIGFFAVFIIFFNTTRERTSLLVKILGISYATLLIMIQGVSYYSLKGLDDSYDTLKKNDMVIVRETDRTVPDLSYLVSYSIPDGRLEIRKGNIDSSAMDFQALQNEYFNTARLEQIRLIGRQPVPIYRREIAKILAGGPGYFSGYRDTILAKVDYLPADTADPGSVTIAHIDSLQRAISSMALEISRLPDRNFAGHLREYLGGRHPGLEHFVAALHSFIAGNGHGGSDLKRDILRFLAPMYPAGTRRYRIGKDGLSHHVAFMEFDPARQVIHEAGFDYRAYREFHHRTAKKFIIMFGIILAVTFAGFRFFFLGAYVRPLRRLLDAITRVREGKDDIVIPITVNDELGYISHNFNEMASTIQMSREALSDYAENLQKMVEERTRELEKARDNIWGEMELARKMQTILIPALPRMEGYEVACYMAPAEMVGGDYYDVINAAGMDWLVIGDVSGHGVPAGIIMMMVQTSIHTILAGNPTIRPSDLLDRVNMVITDNIQKLREDKYMTITVIACMANGRLYTSGLHQDILIYRSRSNEVETVKTCGILLGLRGVIEYVPADRELLLEQGDVMVLYTDGITESWKKGSIRNHRNPRTDMFGQDRLTGILCRQWAGSPEEIRDAVINELKGYHCIDDVTMVIIKKK
jgi:serine phosphatase RsbU (regulator of sigma subunit)